MKNIAPWWKAGLDETQYRPKYPDSPFIHVADLVNQETGKTYREENLDKVHNIPIGTLVEIETGARLFVVHHGRDCDGTPLYELSAKKDDTEQINPRFGNPSWLMGFPEYSLTVIK